MKISIQTLGCKVNQSESSSIAGTLRNNNYQIVDKDDNPDVCVINTCTVTAKSDHESRQLIRKALRSGAKVIATGCYAQLRSKELSEIKGLDLIVGNSGKRDILNYLKEMTGPRNEKGRDGQRRASVCVDKPAGPLELQPYYSNRSRAFLKVQDGCNFACSYCAIPQARGRSRSLVIEDVLKSIDELSQQGYREIVLTGIHAGFYGLDHEPKGSLPRLISRITERYPDIRFRLSSIEPREVSKELLGVIKQQKVCPHLHIPLQNGSDRILKLMNRGYNTKYYQQLINRIITEFPDISIGTDIITGFPGESDNDFRRTVKFIEQLPLSYIHVFQYSKRPDTKAASMGDHISEKEKKKRVKILMEISNNKKKTYMSMNSGRILDVIVEKRDITTGYYKAISDNYLRVYIISEGLQAGSMLKVRAGAIMGAGLLAEPLN